VEQEVHLSPEEQVLQITEHFSHFFPFSQYPLSQSQSGFGPLFFSHLIQAVADLQVLHL